jgi:hypothetical protein
MTPEQEKYILDHKNELVTIRINDNHYQIHNFCYINNPSAKDYIGQSSSNILDIFLQSGSVNISGRNGVTIESLIDLCISHLEYLQSTPFHREKNHIVIHHLSKALQVLDTNQPSQGNLF